MSEAHMLRAKERREIANECLPLVLGQQYKKAAHIRQQAYALNPPGTVGLDWSNFKEIWGYDSRYISQIEDEDYSDLQNSLEFINSLKAGLVIDYFFYFRDMWGIDAAIVKNEEINCPLLDKYLKEKNWPRVNKLYAYARTKWKNIEAHIFYKYSAFKDIKTKKWWYPEPYLYGEYDLGISLKTDPKVLNAHILYLKKCNLFDDMKAAGVKNFPKTFQTFDKHFRLHDEKCIEWLKSYEELTGINADNIIKI